MKALRRSIIVALLLAIPSVSIAQQVARVIESEPIQLTTQADVDQANRETLGAFLSRDEVRRAAVIARVDMGQTMAAVSAMDSDRLANAAQQARVIEEQFALDDVISIRATTLIIVLLLLIILIVAT
jgi:hypothetical protein